jgi:hypothetical protein
MYNRNGLRQKMAGMSGYGGEGNIGGMGGGDEFDEYKRYYQGGGQQSQPKTEMMPQQEMGHASNMPDNGNESVLDKIRKRLVMQKPEEAGHAPMDENGNTDMGYAAGKTAGSLLKMLFGI